MQHSAILNIVLFNCCWYVCVYAGANALVYLPPLAVLLFFVLHLRFSVAPKIDMFLMAICVIAGLGLELLWAASGWIRYPESALLPSWMLCLWAAFALTLNYSLAWLQQRPAIAVILSLLSAPLCYAIGERMGAVQIHAFFAFMSAVALAWAMLIPALLWLAKALLSRSGDSAGLAR